MEFVADLHLHSKYSRAVSPSMTLPVMAAYAVQKGLDILTVADWTHPLWFKEITTQLEEAGQGVYALKSEYQNPKFETNSNYQNTNVQKKVLFLLSTEISSIYKQGDKLRRIHNLVFVPNLETAEKVTREFLRRGCNLSADGRPIIGLTSKNLLEMILSIDEKAFLIPCHIWTPHFGMYGSASGFDSIEESFGDLAKYIYGIETGLSSDPDMNWQVGELKDRSILSFSDAHSPAKMGREATIFKIKSQRSKIKNKTQNLKISYEDIRLAIKRDPSANLEIGYTVEFYPEEGKYHYSGHRNCKFVAGPEDIQKNGNICPVCKRKLTEGVFFRVQQLSDKTLLGRAEIKKNQQGLQWFTDKLHVQPPYVKLVPLLEIVAEALSSTVASQKSRNLYAELCSKAGNEMEILLKTPIEDIAKAAGQRVADSVRKVREGDIVIHPGYDGEYGVVRIWGDVGKRGRAAEKRVAENQLGLDI